MKKINAVIIEDEISAIITMTGMLRDFCPEVNILATASTEKEVLPAILRHSPDLVFLDIEMPPFSNGISIVSQLPERNFEIIITTAYPNYAITSVNLVQPCGYLVKPFSVEQLMAAVKNASSIIHPDSNKPGTVLEQGIIIPDQKKGNLVIRFTEILYFKSDSAIVLIVYNSNGKEQKAVTYKSLKEIEQTLPANFFRIHHSTIVNLDKIARYANLGRSGIVYLNNDNTLEVSVSKMPAFQERFNSYLANGN